MAFLRSPLPVCLLLDAGVPKRRPALTPDVGCGRRFLAQEVAETRNPVISAAREDGRRIVPIERPPPVGTALRRHR